MADGVERREAEGRPTRGASGVNILLGLWLIIAPFVLTYAQASALWNDIIVGVLVIVFASASLSGPRNAWFSWLNAALGLWLVAAPFALTYIELAAFWNDIILGVVILILAAWSASAARPPVERHHPMPH